MSGSVCALSQRSHVCKSSLSPSFLSPGLGSHPTASVCADVCRGREGQKSHSHQRHESVLCPQECKTWGPFKAEQMLCR